MYQITFSKQRYHEVSDMLTWCKQHIGDGGWGRYQEDIFSDYEWDIEQMFGNTTFRFKDAKDYSKFLVKWEWANGQDSTN